MARVRRSFDKEIKTAIISKFVKTDKASMHLLSRSYFKPKLS
jgi:hypothetical protein